MSAKQKTIKYSVSCTGVGLHTGVQSTITFHPAEENSGIKFIRNDIGDKVVTPDIDEKTRGRLNIVFDKVIVLPYITPFKMTEKDIIAMRALGFSDGEILEINQVTAYFTYANRTVLGLGCNTEGDIIGLSPNNSEDPNDWGHS